MAERFLVTGATGQLGAYLVHELLDRGLEVVAWSGSSTDTVEGVPVRPVDLTQADDVARAFREAAPTHVIHAAAMAKPVDCARDPVRADAVNHRGTAKLAQLAAEAEARFVFVSTDLVFDGETAPYRESDAPNPLSVYGRTKVAAEQAVLAIPGHVVVRVSLLFGPLLYGRASFFTELCENLRSGQKCRLFDDEWRTPTSLETAAKGLVEIAASNVDGVLHLAGPERMSRADMGQRLAAYLKLDASNLVLVSRNEGNQGEPRPRDTSLDSSRFRQMFARVPYPPFEAALQQIGIK